MAETEGVYIGNLKIPAFKGEKGDVGDTGKIVGLSAESLNSTATPTVENLGTESEAVLKFGIPKGVSISNVMITNGELILILDDSTTYNLGNVVGKGIERAWLEEGQIYLTYTDGTTVTAGLIYDDALIQRQLAEIETAKDDAISEMNQIKSDVEDIELNINQAKSEIDTIYQEFQDSEEDLQYILNVLGDISTILDDINGYPNGNTEEF